MMSMVSGIPIANGFVRFGFTGGIVDVAEGSEPLVDTAREGVMEVVLATMAPEAGKCRKSHFSSRSSFSTYEPMQSLARCTNLPCLISS